MTLMLTLNAIGMSILQDEYALIPAAILTGIATD
jgi:hypothetical protein